MATHAEKLQGVEVQHEGNPKLTLDRMLKWAKGRSELRVLSRERVQYAQNYYKEREGINLEIGDEVWKIAGSAKDTSGYVVRLRKGSEIQEVDAATLLRIEEAVDTLQQSGLVKTEDSTAASTNVVKTGVKPMKGVIEEVPDEESKVEKAKSKPKLTLRYGAPDISESMENRVRDTAEESLHVEKKDAGFFAKFLKHNVLYDVYRQIAISRERSKILKANDVYAADNLSREARQRATEAIVDRFTAEYGESLHDNGKNGESRMTLGESKEEAKVRADLNALLREYAANEAMDEGELKNRENAIVASANTLAGDVGGKGAMYVSNLKPLAEKLRREALAAGGLDNLDVDLQIVIGRAKLGARTEREKNMVDSALEKLERWGKDKNVIGGVVAAFRNEIAVALATASAIGQFGVRMGLSSTVAKLMTFGGTAVVSGVYGWWKEKGRLNSERALHERQMALGGETRNNDSAEEKEKNILAVEQKLAAVKWWQPLERTRLNRELSDLKNNVAPQPRRKEMEGFELQRASAKDMIDGAKGFMDPSGKELRPDVTIAGATQALAEIEARIRISNFKKIDLLKYTSIAEVEVERGDLDKARMQLKAALRAKYDGDPAVDKAEFKDFQTYFNAIYGLVEGHFSDQNSNAEVQRKNFEKWAQRKARNRGLTTMVIGAGVGVVAHDLWALGTGGDTTIGSIWDSLKAYFGHAPSMVQGPSNVEAIGSGMFKTPSGKDLVPQKDGSFILESVADHKVLASNLHIDGAGNLSAASEKALRGIGATIVESDHVLNGSSITTATQKTWDWIHSHAPLVSKIHRDSWMGNDTPMVDSVKVYDWAKQNGSPGYSTILLKKLFGADFNELKLDWGGSMGVNHNGDFVMDMSKMTPDGSWQGNAAVDAPAELAQGKVRLLLSMNSGSQNHAVEVIVNSKGQAIIPAGSDVAKTFFREVNGKAVFIGKYAEIGVSKGYDAHGVDHLDILATHVGKGITSGVTTTTVGESVSQHVTTICLPSTPSLEVPPFIPLRMRTPMEPLRKRKEEGDSASSVGSEEESDYVSGYYGYERSTDNKEEFRKKRSESLKDNPNAVLDERKEIADYFARIPKKSAEEARKLAKILGPIGKDARLSICIPVAGHQEESSIYESLKNYTKQTADKNEFEIVLFVNHPDTNPKTGEKIVPDGTLTEIARFRNDFPDMPVKVIYEVLPASEARIGKIRKMLTDAVLVRQLERPIGEPELILVSNDADNKGLSPEYVKNYISKFEKNPDVDAMIGQLDWDIKSYIRNPLIHIGTRLFQYNGAQSRFKGWHFNSSGANYAFRSSIYASVGGYADKMKLGEDTDLGAKITAAREGATERTPVIYAGSRVSRLFTSSRRAETLMKNNGLAPVEQWDKGFGAFDDEVRRINWDVSGETIDYKDPEQVSKLVAALETVINRTLKRESVWGQSTANSQFKRSMGWLGIKFEATDEHSIKIIDATKLVRGLEQYQTRGLKILNKKLGTEASV